jgi:hypothetical protein
MSWLLSLSGFLLKKKKKILFCFAFVDFVRMQNCDCKQVKKAQWRPERGGDLGTWRTKNKDGR